MAPHRSLRLALPLTLVLGSLPAPVAASPIFDLSRLWPFGSSGSDAGHRDPVPAAARAPRAVPPARPRGPAAARGPARPGPVAAGTTPRPGTVTPKPTAPGRNAAGGRPRQPGTAAARGQIGEPLVIRNPAATDPQAPASPAPGGTPAGISGGATTTTTPPAANESEGQATAPASTTASDLSGFQVSQTFRAEEGKPKDPRTVAGADAGTDASPAVGIASPTNPGPKSSTPAGATTDPTPTGSGAPAAPAVASPALSPAPAPTSPAGPAAGAATAATPAAADPGRSGTTAATGTGAQPITAPAATASGTASTTAASPGTPAPASASATTTAAGTATPATGGGGATTVASSGSLVGTVAPSTSTPTSAVAAPGTTGGGGGGPASANGPQVGAAPGAWPIPAASGVEGRSQSDAGLTRAPEGMGSVGGTATVTTDPAPAIVAGQGPSRDLGPLAGTPLAGRDAGAGTMPPGTSLIPALFGYEQLHALLGSGGTPLDVNDLVRAPLEGELARATAISDVSQVVASGVGLAGGAALGSGVTPSSPPAPMPPPPVPAPEPSTWVLFAVASLPLLRRARRAGLARRDAAR